MRYGSAFMVFFAVASPFVSSFAESFLTVKIGQQIWMSKNMDVETSEGSWCYDDETENCKKYGRLYTWAAAMKLPESCNSKKCVESIRYPHQGVCPAGYHIPTKDEFETLLEYTERKIRSNTWKSGEDLSGFNLLPSGDRAISSGRFYFLGSKGYLWSSSEFNRNYSWFLMVDGADAYMDDISRLNGFAVRCIRNVAP